MKRIKIAAGLAHVDYGHMADIVTEASGAGVDYIHSDAADMHDLKNMQLMGGHQIIESIRAYTDKPIECHAYLQVVDKLFIEKIANAGADMLVLPAEWHLGAPLAYTIRYCRDFGVKIGLTVGCFTPLCFVDEAIYELDRLHVVVHGINDDRWMWRRSALPMVRNARLMIAEKNPGCELAVDGGIRSHNVEELVAQDVDVVVASSAIFKHPEGIKAGVKEFRQAVDQAAAKHEL
jgi:ribulose-phosphate 3-epimerase